MRATVVTAALTALGLVAAGACNDGTRIRVTVVGGDSLGLELYQLQIEDRAGASQPAQTLELLVPDQLAGTSAKLELWGLRGGNQAAYATATITPERDGVVDATLTLTEVTCGQWCQVGTTRCANDGTTDGTQSCTQDASGCVGWSPAATCPAATPFCTNGACGETCADECSEGSPTCDGATAVRTCGQFDTDECLDWSTTSCGGALCTDGECGQVPPCNVGDACPDRQPECVSATTLRMYSSGGMCTATNGCEPSYIDATCPLGCVAGGCKPNVAAGGANSCAIKPDGKLACWGGMLNTTLPTASFRAISVKEWHGCGMTTGGAADCWSRDTFGNLAGECDVPAGSFSAVTTGDHFSCGVHTSGTLECWGDNTQQQQSEPAGTFSSVSGGLNHVCAVRTTGTAACWGRNTEAQVPAISGSFIQVAAGYAFSCGIRPGGALECWGTIEAPPAGSFINLSAGFDHACATRIDGIVMCWGANTSNKRTPPAGTYSYVTAGDQHTCALRTDGTIACWGDNSKGATNVPSGL